MLNRRILRIKAFKEVYSYALTGRGDAEASVQRLDEACEATRDLYLWMLALLPALCRESGRRADTLSRKFNPGPGEAAPNHKFARNLAAAALASDIDFQKAIGSRSLEWDEFNPFVANLYDVVCTRDYFRKYMDDPSQTLGGDALVLRDILRRELVDESSGDDAPAPVSEGGAAPRRGIPEQIDALVQDRSLLWTDDLAYALGWCCSTLEDTGRGRLWRLPELYMSDIVRRRKPGARVDSDQDFVHAILRQAIAKYEDYFQEVAALVPEWKPDRLFSTDMALVALCLGEMEACPEIPKRISLFEYVEISKFYCSPKSRAFVNGILDRIAKAHYPDDFLV